MTAAQVKRPASMASNISSEFEEVHLEEVEHSTSTGSGEEVEIPSGTRFTCPSLCAAYEKWVSYGQ